MRPLRYWKPLCRSTHSRTVAPTLLASCTERSCSTSRTLWAGRPSKQDSDTPLPNHDDKKRLKREQERGRVKSSQGPQDHRIIGTNQSLWTHHHSSPGSPFFLPAGAHIFQRLIEFLRAQYPAYGFQEVLTPTLYKRSLWEQSGHWQNYKNDMFTVKGGNAANDVGEEEFSLKPMNCPGHCLLFASKRRSYRDLPIRYADFSPLHRDEISGALSGLTRVRRFHQDDGHIFCRRMEVQNEVREQLRFIEMVYNVFGLEIHKVVLSTRPEKDYIGDVGEWKSAEDQLKMALTDSAMDWTINSGDGAFYGPKIDVIVRDCDGREHQTATIQLDFQLPKRFNLTYASEVEGSDEQPVMIHRAIFGSLERFMALLAEQYNGRWPFWLNPDQVMILTVSNEPMLVKYARDVAALLRQARPQVRQALYSPTFNVNIDHSGDSIGKKVAKVKNDKSARYNVICVLGDKNRVSNLLDLDLSGMPRLGDGEDDLASIRSHLNSAGEEDSTISTTFMASSKISLSPSTLIELMKKWTEDYL